MKYVFSYLPIRFDSSMLDLTVKQEMPVYLCCVTLNFRHFDNLLDRVRYSMADYHLLSKNDTQNHTKIDQDTS
jgi:hypothetical protein